MNLDLVLLLLFSIATGVALFARWLKIPYTVALVVAGLIIGIGKWLPAPHLSKALLFSVFLPGLLFEAAFHIDAKKLWANRIAVNALAVPGVVAAIAVTAFLLTPAIRALHLDADFRFIDGLVFGGIVAATDPIAVVALFKSLGVPQRLGVLIEGESLLNDGTAVVLFGLIMSIATGEHVTFVGATFDFLRTCGLGILLGAAIGYGGSRIIHLVDDPMLEITITVVVAWGSFALSEQLHASGVLATVSAGLVCGNYAARTEMSATTKIAAIAFWAYVAFALNSIVFLLIGLEVELAGVLAAWQAVLLAWLATTLARAIVVAVVTMLLRRSREKLPRGWATILCWGGLRGGLSMVLVLALPSEFRHRQFLINVVFGVVVLSILVQGLSMAPLLKRLGIIDDVGARLDYQRARAHVLAARAALEELEQLCQSQPMDADVLQELRAYYLARIEKAEEQIRELRVSDSILVREERKRIERRLIFVERERILKARREGLPEEAAAELFAELDSRQVALDDQGSAAPIPPADSSPSTPASSTSSVPQPPTDPMSQDPR